MSHIAAELKVAARWRAFRAWRPLRKQADGKAKLSLAHPGKRAQARQKVVEDVLLACVVHRWLSVCLALVSVPRITCMLWVPCASSASSAMKAGSVTAAFQLMPLKALTYESAISSSSSSSCSPSAASIPSHSDSSSSPPAAWSSSGPRTRSSC